MDVVDPGAGPGILDVAHRDPAARARFARPPLMAFDALWWTEVGGTLPAGLEPATEAFRLTLEAHVGWHPADPGAGLPGDVVKQVSFLCAAEGYGEDRFREHYRHHVALARRHMPALWRYVQNDVVGRDDGVASSAPAGIPPFVAVSELWFRTTADFCERYFPSAEDQRQFSAAEGFLDLTRAVSFVCTSLAPPAGP